MPRRMPFDLAAGEWWRVPRIGNTRLSDVFSPLGTAAVIAAWGGACIDTLRKDILVFGGGHTDSTDNAVYAFCFDPASANYLTWRRKVSSSATAANDDSETNADGNPASRHTYNSLHYHAGLDQMIVGPGGFLSGPGGVRSDAAWGFDCATENPGSALLTAWTRYDDGLSASLGNPRASMAYDPATAKYYTEYNTGFTSFDPTLGTGSQWVGLTSFEGPNTSDNTTDVALLSPNQMVWVNTADGGELWARFMTDPWAYVGSEVNGIGATGDINIMDVAAPGMRWEPQLDAMVLWGGLATGGTDARDVYVFDVMAKTVTRKAGKGDTPTAPQANGTFGRWAYLGGCGSTYSGLWILVNSATEEAFFYRSSGGSTDEDVGFVTGSPFSFSGEAQTGAREFVPAADREQGQGFVTGSPYSFSGEAMTGGPEFVPGASQGPGFVTAGDFAFTGEMATGAPDTAPAGPTIVSAPVAIHTYTGRLPKVGARVSPAQVLHTYTAQTPQVRVSVKPGAVLHTYAAQTPQVRAKVAAPVALHTYTALVPVITSGATVVVPVATHTYTARTPQVTARVMPPQATHTYFVRTPQARVSVRPAQATHTYTGNQPKIQARVAPAAVLHTYTARIPQTRVKVMPGAALHTYSANVPAVIAGGTNSVAPPQATHTYSGRVPTVNARLTVAAVRALHTYTASVPRASASIRPPAALHVYSGVLPVVFAAVFQPTARYHFKSAPQSPRIGESNAAPESPRLGQATISPILPRIGSDKVSE